MVSIEHLRKKLAEDLSQERPIGTQVMHYIADHYGFGEDDLPQFFQHRVPILEDYELDLVFSPLFTPTLEDRLAYAPILLQDSLTPEEIDQQITHLTEERQVFGHIITPKGQNLPMVLKEVTIQRFVNRLHLERKLHPDVFSTIQACVLSEVQPVVNILARDPVWQEDWRRDMLIVFLQLQKQRKPFTQEKMIHFTDFLRTYKPLGFKDMEQRLQSLIKSCEKDLDGVRGRGFLDPHLKEMYADEIALEAAERGAEKKVTATYQEMIVKANELLQDAITLRELMPEAIQKIESKTSQTV